MDTRSILRKLDKLIAFPEEAAILLKRYEHRLLDGVSAKTFLAGISYGLGSKSTSDLQGGPKDAELFHKLVSHFYLVNNLAGNLVSDVSFNINTCGCVLLT